LYAVFLILDVLDVYCTAKHRVRIVDFNCFSTVTDSILFEWDELQAADTNLGMRVIESNEVARGTQPAFTHNRLPKEAFDFSADGAGIAEFAERFNRELLVNAVESKEV
jgi:D123